jgi:soluble lytic murein transglycosylase-like protein
MVTNRQHDCPRQGDSAFEQMTQGAGSRFTGACRARVKSGQRLTIACAFFFFSPAAPWASTDTPAPAAISFAYTVSHTVKPLPDAVIDQVVDPFSDSFDADEADAFDPYERPVDVRLGAPRQLSQNGLCSAVASVAKANNLPIPFFANLIWQESNFDTKTISRAGAQGIAQFMPKTAVEFGLINPFEPIHALNVAGKFVRELYEHFGNLGLAAAAYNAGPRRVSEWMAKRGALPTETRNYVLRITGRAADEWAAPRMTSNPEASLMPAKAPCAEVAEAVKAQVKTVRLAKLMMELSAAATQARDTQDDSRPIDVGPAVTADANWRARALHMVNTVLLRLSKKEAHKASATMVANTAIRSTIRIVSRELHQSAEPLPGKNARRASVRSLDPKASDAKLPDARIAMAKAVDESDSATKAAKGPNSTAAKVAGAAPGNTEAGKPAVTRRYRVRTQYAYQRSIDGNY